MHTQKTPTDIEAELRRISSDGRPGRYPSSAAILGRAVLKHAYGRWVGVTSPVPLAELGSAAKTLELVGLSWCNLSSPEKVVQAAETALTLAAHALVTERQLPMSWLIGDSGQKLGEGWLSFIGRAIELAEVLGEDWRQWINTTTAADVIVCELPRLQVLVEAKAKADAEATITAIAEESAAVPMPTPAAVIEAKAEPKCLSKGARRALRKQKARARAEATKVKPTAVQPPAPEPTPEVKFTPGLVLHKDGVQHVVCTGRHGQCLKLTPVSEARVAQSVGWVKRTLRLERYQQINEDNLVMISFCADCAEFALREGSLSIPEAIVARDDKIEEIEAYWKAENARREYERKLEVERIGHAKRARNNGAFGDPSRPRPAAYLARKAQKAAKSRAEMRKGATSGGGQKGGQSKKKGR